MPPANENHLFAQAKQVVATLQQENILGLNATSPMLQSIKGSLVADKPFADKVNFARAFIPVGGSGGYISEEKFDAQLTQLARLGHQYKMMNCMIATALVVEELSKRKIPYAVVDLPKCDHRFVVIGLNDLPQNVKQDGMATFDITQHKNAVVIDFLHPTAPVQAIRDYPATMIDFLRREGFYRGLGEIDVKHVCCPRLPEDSISIWQNRNAFFEERRRQERLLAIAHAIKIILGVLAVIFLYYGLSAGDDKTPKYRQ